MVPRARIRTWISEGDRIRFSHFAMGESQRRGIADGLHAEDGNDVLPGTSARRIRRGCGLSDHEQRIPIARRFPREREEQDRLRREVLFDAPRHAVGQRARLSRPGARDDKKRANGMGALCSSVSNLETLSLMLRTEYFQPPHSTEPIHP